MQQAKVELLLAVVSNDQASPARGKVTLVRIFVFDSDASWIWLFYLNR